jgi:hypothetical protein
VGGFLWHDLNGTVYKFNKKEGLGLWCLMPLSTISQLYRGSQINNLLINNDHTLHKIEVAHII